MAVEGRQYSYSYRNTNDNISDSVVINVRCPAVSSHKWCYKLYSLVLAGLGLFLSFCWVCFHLYVLSQTTTMELRLLRYLDIFLGLMEFLSMLSLLYGTYSNSRLFIIIFMTSSLGVLVMYWAWYTYYSYDSDTLVYDDQTGVCIAISLSFLVLLLPVCLQYRSLELQSISADQGEGRESRKAEGRQERQHRDRSPPPKYQESFDH